MNFDVFEIGKAFIANIDHKYSFEEVFTNSIVIEGVRYNSLEFLLKIKRIWVVGKNPREKDIKDIETIEQYLKCH